jgi:hypothetical protein
MLALVQFICLPVSQSTRIYNFWLDYSVFFLGPKGRIQIDGVWEQDAKENIWTYETVSHSRR